MFEDAAEMTEKITDAGFEIEGLREKLEDFLASGENILQMRVPVGEAQQRLTADFDIYQEEGKYLNWHHYYLRSPREVADFEHFVNNGIDSRELDQRFAALDWSNGMKEAHWSAVAGIGDFAEGYVGRNEVDQSRIMEVIRGLLCKHVGGSDAEKMILEKIPPYRELFYQPHFFWSEVPLTYALKKIIGPKQVILPVSNIKKMNINKMNLENLQAEMRALKFDEKLIVEMEKQMVKGRPLFELNAAVVVDRGQMDMKLQFKQSGSSEYYYLNRYELSMTNAKPLEGDKKYWVIGAEKNEKGEYPTKSFVNLVDAIEHFKTGDNVKELAIGKTAADRFLLASRDEVKVDYVEKDFRMAYYGNIKTNTFYVDRGKGINVQQGINLMLGRSVYRDDLVNRGTGEVYKAWNTFEFNEPKDRYGNYKVKQYGENYGTDVIKELASYNIKELSDPKKEAEVIASLKDGHRPVVTVKDEQGQEQKMRIEAMPRYGNYNFYTMDGKLEKREQFMKESAQAVLKEPKQGLGKNKDQQQGMSM